MKKSLREFLREGEKEQEQENFSEEELEDLLEDFDDEFDLENDDTFGEAVEEEFSHSNEGIENQEINDFSSYIPEEDGFTSYIPLDDEVEVSEEEKERTFSEEPSIKSDNFENIENDSSKEEQEKASTESENSENIEKDSLEEEQEKNSSEKKSEKESPLQEEEESVNSLKNQSTKNGGLAGLSKELANLSQKYANSSELDGLSISAKVVNPLIRTVATILETREKLKNRTTSTFDKQKEGSAVAIRLSEVKPDCFISNSPKSFIWKDPETQNKYRFEVSGGLIKENGKTKQTPKILKSIDLTNNEEVFKANSIDNRKWQIEKCDFNRSQLISLQSAHVIKEKKNHDLSKSKKSDKSKAKKQVELEI